MSMAEEVVDGLLCVTCMGVYFKKAHGYPVQCIDCKRHSPDPDYPQATEKQVR